MISEEKKTIIAEVFNNYVRSSIKKDSGLRLDVDHLVKLFIKVLEQEVDEEKLQGVGPRLSTSISALAEKQDIESLINLFPSINKNEQYARKLLYILKRERYREIVESKKGFSPFITELRENGSQISNRKKSLMLDIRNAEDHNMFNWDIIEFHQNIGRYLLNYLLLTDSQIDALNKMYFPEETFDDESWKISDYIEAIIYKHEQNKSFHYFNFSWMDNDGEDNYDASAVIELLKTQTVKVFGEAGSGKSTIISQIELMLAKKIKKKKSTQIPILIQLKDMLQPENTITGFVAESLDISRENATKMMNDGKICLLLDGFNEILNVEMQKRLSFEIDQLNTKYAQLSILLSDRAMSGTIAVLRGAKNLSLQKLNDELKMKFLQENNVEEDALALIRNTMENNRGLLDDINTPLKLLRYGKLVEDLHAIPEDFTGEYLRYLLSREFNEKKDKTAKILPDILKCVACKMINSDSTSLKELEMKLMVTEAMQKLGYNNVNSITCIDLAIDLGILSKEGNEIQFASESFLNNYFIEGMQEGYDCL